MNIFMGLQLAMWNYLKMQTKIITKWNNESSTNMTPKKFSEGHL